MRESGGLSPNFWPLEIAHTLANLGEDRRVRCAAMADNAEAEICRGPLGRRPPASPGVRGRRGRRKKRVELGCILSVSGF